MLVHYTCLLIQTQYSFSERVSMVKNMLVYPYDMFLKSTQTCKPKNLKVSFCKQRLLHSRFPFGYMGKRSSKMLPLMKYSFSKHPGISD